MAYRFLNNSIEQWGVALALAACAALLMQALHALTCRKIARHGDAGAGPAILVAARVVAATSRLFILAAALYVGSLGLQLPAADGLLVRRAAFTVLLVQAGVWGDAALRAWRDRLRDGDPARRASAGVLCFVSRLVLWAVALLMVLDNLGLNITTLVASLGIGGIAVALAVQNILGDLFASLSIMLDKPFEIGDFIIVGEALGTVEHIGLKTTRVRGLGGEQVVFSNGDLLKSRIHNHKRMQTRRVAFILRVAYGTPEQQLLALPELIRQIVAREPDVDFERAHFFRYGEWSLDVEVVYHYRSPDYIAHMDAQQRILFALYRRFEHEGIQFAHPLSVIRLADPAPAARPAPAPPSAAPTRH